MYIIYFLNVNVVGNNYGQVGFDQLLLCKWILKAPSPKFVQTSS
jgi:hypothetical protein